MSESCILSRLWELQGHLVQAAERRASWSASGIPSPEDLLLVEAVGC